ncbi:hypothetical protein ACVWYR_000194 [Pantoea agglomerans]
MATLFGKLPTLIYPSSYIKHTLYKGILNNFIKCMVFVSLNKKS